MIRFGHTVRKGKLILLVLFVLLSVKSAYAETTIPTASITLDGNPSDWSSIHSVYTDAQGDDNTGYTGADIKSYKFAQDSDYVYVMADFYDGIPNQALGQAEAWAYQFHFAYAETSGGPLSNHIDSLGIFHDGSQWGIHYLSLFKEEVGGSLIGSSVAVGSVIELEIPKNKLFWSFDFLLQIGTDLGIGGDDERMGDKTDWETLYCVAGPIEAIQDLADSVEKLDLPQGTVNSLTAKLEAAINSLNRGRNNAAINQLSAFINQVEALRRSERLTDEQADELISMAQRIIDSIQAANGLTEVRQQAAPAESSLSQNYPNPFNPETTIEYEIEKDCEVTLKVYNLSGQLIKTLVDEYKTTGHHTITWHGDTDAGGEVASGVYFYRIRAGEFVSIKKMVVLK